MTTRSPVRFVSRFAALLSLVAFASPAVAGNTKVVSGFVCQESTTTKQWKYYSAGAGIPPIMKNHHTSSIKVICPIHRDNNELEMLPYGYALNELKIAVFASTAVSCQLWVVSTGGVQQAATGLVNSWPSSASAPNPAFVSWYNVAIPFDGTVFAECTVPKDGQILYLRYEER